MDFELDEAQRAIAATAAAALERAAAGASLTGRGPGGVPDAEATWRELAKAGLLAVALPDWLEGDELGADAAGILLAEVGRRAACVPALATVMLGVLPVVRWGSRALQERVLDGVADGQVLLTAGLREPSRPSPAAAVALAELDRLDGAQSLGTVSGAKVGVPYAGESTWILVPAAVSGAAAGAAGGRAVVIVEAAAPGVTTTRSPASGATPEYTVRLDAAPVVGVLPGRAAVDDLSQLAAAGAAAVGAGAVSGALDLTTSHVARREQFGRPLATFQSVAQHVADVYITSRTLHLAATSACWRLSSGRDAALDAAVAAHWLAAEAPAALRTCHHLHGGVGLDISYPLHRYYSLVKDLARLVGGADHLLDVLAAMIAAREREREPCAGRPAADLGAGRPGREPSASGSASSRPRAAGRDGGMFIDLTDAQRQLRDELRGYFASVLTPSEREAMATDRHCPAYRSLVRRLGRDGWLGVGWPTEFGGRGFGQLEQQIFVSEAARADVPLPAVTLQTVGPTLQRYGTDQQKRQFLPRILAGEVHFAIGYTEPGAGTDLAALTTRAVRDGDWYVVNGQKIFTSGAHDADYIWLACRTDPDAPRHKGISILIVDTADPGFSWTPIITADGAHHVNATYYADVRVPVAMRVGAENEGWRLVTTQLNHERVMLGPAGRLGALHDRVLAWARSEPGQDGWPVLREPDMLRALAQARACMRVNELLNWQVAVAPTMEVADASATKVFASERLLQLGQVLADVVGRHGDPAGEPTASLLRWLDVQDKRNLVLTFGGGVNEVQRELIATAGLGLPRVPR